MISLVVGLGNVGAEYVGTRHNVGFGVVDRVARQLEGSRRVVDEHYESALAQVPDEKTGGRRVVLAWPTTYMNRSGLAVSKLLEHLEIEPRNCLVVVDDIDLPLGALRFRSRGSAGGHNGLSSIIEVLGTEDFPRLRLGIGRSADKEEVADFVLSRFEPDELETAEKMLAKAAEAVIFALSHRLEEAMSQFNSNPALPEEA